MMALFATVLVASLIGSVHCAGMCGAFAAIAASAPCESDRMGRPLRVVRVSSLASYNLGRLVVYAALGVSAGALGALVDLGGAWVGLQRAAAVMAGLAMCCVGVVTFSQSLGARIPRPKVPVGLQRAVGFLHRVVAGWPPNIRPAVIGLLSGILPCGWLYAFVLVAAGTANPAFGAIVMVAFWLGTVPILLSLGAGAQALLGSMRSSARLVAALSLIVVGLLTAVSRVDRGAAAFAHAQTVPTSIEQSIQTAAQADSASLPCCHHDGGN